MASGNRAKCCFVALGEPLLGEMFRKVRSSKQDCDGRIPAFSDWTADANYSPATNVDGLESVPDKVLCTGPATYRKLAEWGVPGDVLPSCFVRPKGKATRKLALLTEATFTISNMLATSEVGAAVREVGLVHEDERLLERERVVELELLEDRPNAALGRTSQAGEAFRRYGVGVEAQSAHATLFIHPIATLSFHSAFSSLDS